MKRVIYVSLFILMIYCFAFAQTTESNQESKNSDCPTIQVIGPPTSVQAGEHQVFTLTIEGKYDRDKLEIEWTVHNGEIVSGQGTNIVDVKSIEQDSTMVVTANVKTGEDCVLSASESAVLGCEGINPILFDEFGRTGNGDVKVRLEMFSVELENNPDATGYIVNYGSTKDIEIREKLIRNHFSVRSMPLDRIVFVNGGIEKEIRTRLWIVPAGADSSIVD